MAGVSYPEAVGPTYPMADPEAGIQDAINCYPRKLDGDRWQMVSIPGEVQFASLGAECRGSRNVEGRWFVVAGSTLYELDASGAATSRGSLLTYSGVVGMAHNASQVVIVDGQNLYVFSLDTNTLTQVTSSGWRGSDSVVEIDGYMVFVDPETDQFYLSAIDDASTLDALDFSSADVAPDDVIAHRVSHRQLFLFGTRTTEIWINSGGIDFPFVRYQSYSMDVGIVGKHAVVNAADTLFWIGRTDRGTGIVYMMVGNQPQRVSTVPIEQMLIAADLSNATMWAYQIEGHEFVGINAPGMATTLVYDAALQLWHQRAEWVNGAWEPIRARLHTLFGNEHYAMDEFGVVVRLDDEANTLNGRVLKRQRTWPHIRDEGLEPISFRGLEVDVKTGSGTTASLVLEVSGDGGSTFGPPLPRLLGSHGERARRVRWTGLGTSRKRVFRLWMTDAAPFALYRAAVQI